HSSARIERFLTLCARGNMRLAQPTTAAQYFHLLRSQVRGAQRRPLVVFTPKSLLRLHQSRSALQSLTEGWFQEVVDDPATTGSSAGTAPGPLEVDVAADGVQRILLCSGKFAYEAMARRNDLIAAKAGSPESGVDPSAVAVVRIEQLYPWPEVRISEVLDRYPVADEIVWVQEEPENMGAWSFVHGRPHRLVRDRFDLSHVSRPESPSPATGSAALHQLELEDLLQRSFA
ncbi:MAG: 2-oxoglutarate dehydrogenase E1 component, partial [Acidimicrobiales bacterium]